MIKVNYNCRLKVILIDFDQAIPKNEKTPSNKLPGKPAYTRFFTLYPSLFTLHLFSNYADLENAFCAGAPLNNPSVLRSSSNSGQ